MFEHINNIVSNASVITYLTDTNKCERSKHHHQQKAVVDSLYVGINSIRHMH